MSSRKLPVFSALMLLLLAGCSHRPSVAPGSRFAVHVARAAFYKNGPAQSSGPDLYLERGRCVRVTGTQHGYSQVVIEDGVSGYIAARQLHLAPPEVLPPVAEPAAPPAVRSATPAVEPDLPGLDLSDLPPALEKTPGPLPSGDRSPER